MHKTFLQLLNHPYITLYCSCLFVCMQHYFTFCTIHITLCIARVCMHATLQQLLYHPYIPVYYFCLFVYRQHYYNYCILMSPCIARDHLHTCNIIATFVSFLYLCIPRVYLHACNKTTTIFLSIYPCVLLVFNCMHTTLLKFL